LGERAGDVHAQEFPAARPREVAQRPARPGLVVLAQNLDIHDEEEHKHRTLADHSHPGRGFKPEPAEVGDRPALNEEQSHEEVEHHPEHVHPDAGVIQVLRLEPGHHVVLDDCGDETDHLYAGLVGCVRSQHLIHSKLYQNLLTECVYHETWHREQEAEPERDFEPDAGQLGVVGADGLGTKVVQNEGVGQEEGADAQQVGYVGGFIVFGAQVAQHGLVNEEHHLTACDSDEYLHCTP